MKMDQSMKFSIFLISLFYLEKNASICKKLNCELNIIDNIACHDNIIIMICMNHASNIHLS